MTSRYVKKSVNISKDDLKRIGQAALSGTGAILPVHSVVGSGSASMKMKHIPLLFTPGQITRMKKVKKPFNMKLTKAQVGAMYGQGFLGDAIRWLGEKVAAPIASQAANWFVPGSGDSVDGIVNDLADKLGNAAELGVDGIKKNKSAKKTAALVKGHLRIYKLQEMALDRNDPEYQEKKEALARQLLANMEPILREHGEKHINKPQSNEGGSIGGKKKR